MVSQILVHEWLPIAIRTSGIERKLIAGQALFRRGDRAAGLYEVVSGRIRLMGVDQEGRELAFGIRCAGDTVAEESLFSLSYCCIAVASTKSVVRLYQKGSLLAEFARNPKAAQLFAAVLSYRVMDLRTRLERRNIYSARDRVRHYLAGAQDSTVILPGTVKDLAGELGLSHEALYRTLSEMKNEGEIVRHGGRIRLVHPVHDWDQCPELHQHSISKINIRARS
jgi:CRP-like cAMP-binding protein